MSNTKYLPLILALLAAGMAAASCRKGVDPNADRSDYINVFASPEGEVPLDAVSASVKGGPATMFIRTNLDDFKIQWQDDGTTPWVKVLGTEKRQDDLVAIQLEVAPRYTYPYYTRRTGTLLISCPEKNFGKFVKVHQGINARISSDMAWSKYGSNNPLKQDGAISAT